MPTRHGKQHSHVFSYEERKKLNWGTQSRRAGADSTKDWDACGLCLHQVSNPVVCPRGHLYCKECVYNSLLTQKQEIKRKAELFEIQERDRVQEEEERLVDKQLKAIDDFTNQETNVLPSSSSSSSSAPRVIDNNTGYETIETKQGTMYMVDREQVAANASKRRYEMTKEEKEVQKRMTPAFWLPALTPEAEKPLLKAPEKHTMCPSGDHTLRLKQLKPLKLSLSDPTNGMYELTLITILI